MGDTTGGLGVHNRKGKFLFQGGPTSLAGGKAGIKVDFN
jgi:hypothetical protein